MIGRLRYAQAADSSTHAPGTMARHMALGPRMDRVLYGGDLGARSTHHRPVGRRLGVGGPRALIFEQSGGTPRPRPGASGGIEGGGPRIACGSGHRSGQLELEGGPPVRLGAVRHLPEPQELSGLTPSTRGQALHRLGFVLKRPRKRLVKADERKREAFVADYARLWDEARRCGNKFFFAGEAHFRAGAELRGKWALKGEPALVDSSSPRRGEKASCYSAVCLETGEGEWMELEGNSNSEPEEMPRALSLSSRGTSRYLVFNVNYSCRTYVNYSYRDTSCS